MWNDYTSTGLLKWSQQTLLWFLHLSGNSCKSLQGLLRLTDSPHLFHISYQKNTEHTEHRKADVIARSVINLSSILLFACIVCNNNAHLKQFHHGEIKKQQHSRPYENTPLREHPCIHVRYLYIIKLSSFRHTSCYKYKYRNKVPLVVDYCNK
uniref:Uncharacterized protein n=1 Tax=Rhipicephalus zambeziensis TaxID=60191 RepID=A0A224YFP3_9ACAR